ncbi:M20/M25/M40 family metallo-hydrolase [Pelagicoccus albus]|uniref:M20/M25/M40 family metallo-hydrolase n=1 Tax=Pelagicoccus albus TaxID=415222 RepID=A0A7X1B300_9BACT|nr:M20/M25/M40 family metallo-hydrolase [Pelagicoccus albus]MBC2604705.1 M20/M25/M40 family metallo-hydrolase [Pelagicoccus albus]
MTSEPKAPEFLLELLEAKSPSGAEQQSQAVYDKYVKPVADVYKKDTIGNRIGILNPENDTSVLFAGHLDELGLQINYVDENGFLYFNTLGGHDRIVISGRRVLIQTRNGIVKGVTGKRAVHLMDAKDREKVPQIHEMWIDIAAEDKEEALSRVQIGDVATYDHEFEFLHGTVATARAFDNKGGSYIVGEALRRLSKEKADLQAKVISVANAQEEVGVRGAMISAFNAAPTFAVAVDVGHATDHPDCDKRKFGEFKLGSGPIITRGPNINPIVYQKLIDAAEANDIPYQLEGDPRPTGTDARAIQVAGPGVATGLISLPLRYMHTPSEVIDLQDAEYCIQLLCAFAKGLKDGENGNW